MPRPLPTTALVLALAVAAVLSERLAVGPSVRLLPGHGVHVSDVAVLLLAARVLALLRWRL